jgi:DNA primase
MLNVLSADERGQLRVERELLAMMAEQPDAFRGHADRIADFSWCDSRDQSIAWAILSTPEGTAPAEVVRTAEQVVPEAPGILAGGTLASDMGVSEGEKVSFLLDSVDLYSTRRKVREIRAKLAGISDSEEATRLFSQATQLQLHEKKLQQRLSGVKDSG